MRDADPPTLAAEDIVTGYDSHQVLNGVSFENRDGVTAVFGPNGSGKSTLLKSLNGLVPIWSGTVQYGGETITENTPEEIVSKGVVTLPQGGGIFESLSVEENLKVGAFTVDDAEVVTRRLDEVLDVFPDLEGRLDERARDLSGGQQMMVSLGRAMMTGADTYLLDEPSAGLAPALVDDALELIQTLVDQGARVVLVEQNVTAALRLTDYVYILAEGEVQFHGPPDDLADREDLLDLYLGL
jgi:ABC-type branched-subunit amino acid transport system ATPase component